MKLEINGIKNSHIMRDLIIKSRISEEKKNELKRKDAEEYLSIHEQKKHFLVKKILKLKHFLKWTIRLLIPDFLIGHPNLFDNLKILFRNRQFKPFRMAIAAWLIFSVTAISYGVYLLSFSNKTRASRDYSINTGYYYGNGTSLSIEGVGFRPELILIKSDTATGQIVWKSSVMSESEVSYLGVATANNTDSEITFDDDGFTLSSALEVNAKNVRYVFIAFDGSDCSTGNTSMCIGKITGNGLASQAISTGFRPDLVWAKRTGAVVGNFTTSALASINPTYAAYFSAAANDMAGTGLLYKSIDDDGFTVGLTNNANGAVYYYVAFKNIVGRSAVGSFLGDGVDNRNISGLGFEPDFVFVKQNSAVGPAFNTTECWGDYSLAAIAGAGALNHIQSLDPDGFQIGNSTAVNAGGILSFWFAFGGAPDPAPTESFLMERGHYVGDGSGSRSVSTSFAPDLVFIKADDSAQYAVWSTRRDTDITHYFAYAGASFANGIISMEDNSFILGNHATVNSNGINYEYVAFGNATTPQTGPHAANLVMGSYSGNGATPTTTPRVIDHLGITPDFVLIKPTVVTAASNINYWKTSSMTDSYETAYLNATANDKTGTLIRSLDSENGGGFTIGSNSYLNSNGVVYLFFAFKETAGTFDVGTYEGDGVDDREITGLGFNPDFMWTKRNGTTVAVHRSSSSFIADGYSQYFSATINALNMIKGFVTDGFKLGLVNEVNTATAPKTYHYVAWKATGVSSIPDTPINVSPADLEEGIDLNIALISSDYSDPDSNPQTNTQWQVDNDTSFITPVWRRTSGASENTTSITFANGIFANELEGKNELDHNKTYYWRVKYSNGIWSNWSTPTSFITNKIETPTNVSPADSETVKTQTPILNASSFSDQQITHAPLSAEWQISTEESFSSPIYDSQIVGYGNSHAIPNAILSDQTVYYWRVRYQDSSEQWSSYSTPTRFLVAKSEVVVDPLFGSTVVDQGDNVNIDAQIKLSDETVVNDATVTISIYDPEGTKIVEDQPMLYITDSKGIYQFNSFTIPNLSGSYLYEVTATTNDISGYGANNFEVRTIQSDIKDISADLAAHEAVEAAERAAEAAERASQAVERIAQENERSRQESSRETIDEIDSEVEEIDTDVDEIKTKTDEINTKTTDIQNKVINIQSNLDILIGAFIVTQSSISDVSPTPTSFITTLTNSTEDFYKNAVLTFTSGGLNGQSRRISGYNALTKTISLGPALSFAPSNGDLFTITKQNVRVEEQATEIKETVSDTNTKVTDIQTKTTDIQTKVTDIQTKTDSMYSLLQTVDSNLSQIQSSINNIRASQEKLYNLQISNVDEMQTNSNYRLTLTIRNFEGNSVDISSLPTVRVYDSTREQMVNQAEMTKISTGVYEYVYLVPSQARTGLWETIVEVDTGGTEKNTLNDYWQVIGSPAQVKINSISDNTIPSIIANTSIQNEGNGDFEYQYKYCIVANQDNACGGGDDLAYGSGAKLIKTGETFNQDLSLEVNEIGTYWFKIVVNYGTESSGASLQFTAVKEEEKESSPNKSGSYQEVINLQSVYSEILNMRQDLQKESAQLSKTLALIGNVDPNSPGFKSLLEVNNSNTKDIKEVQNKISDLKAVLATTEKLYQNNSVTPIVETYMKFNSVEINFLITNPIDKAQTIKFSAFLPEEAKPENIMDSDGLKVEYDPNAKTYFVSGEISLGPAQTITKKVEMKDIWVFDETELNLIKQQAQDILKTLEGTQFKSQGIILKGDIESTINIILSKQKDSYNSPQDHIVAYRENKERVEKVEEEFNQLKNLLSQYNSSSGIVGNIGGIQTFATWGIILVIVFGFGLLATVIFAMWRHQTKLVATEIMMNRKELDLINNNGRQRI